MREMVAAPALPATALEATDLTVRFGGIVALDKVSITIPVNQISAVIGPNGAGKTTFFNAVCGFVRPHAGSVTYAGRPLNRVHPHQLTSLGISRTLQGLGLWPGLTVLENVMVGAPRARRPNIAWALSGLPRSDRDETAVRRAALESLAGFGIERYAGALPGALPFGVQKHVALARALASKPSLLLLDEPASGLTEGEIKDLVDRLRGWRSTMTIALVEHRLDLVMKACDRVTVLDFGKVIAAGTPAEVSVHPAVTSAYLGERLEPTDA
jgi:branched-chain amino acid transport system ATP-binding protein